MLKKHPARTLGVWAAVTAALFLLSASGQPGTFWSSGPGWLGALGWTGFGLSLLTLVIFGLHLGVSRFRDR